MYCLHLYLDWPSFSHCFFVQGAAWGSAHCSGISWQRGRGRRGLLPSSWHSSAVCPARPRHRSHSCSPGKVPQTYVPPHPLENLTSSRHIYKQITCLHSVSERIQLSSEAKQTLVQIWIRRTTLSWGFSWSVRDFELWPCRFCLSMSKSMSLLILLLV